ncbi:MAG: nucleotide exchange factor GrpE [Armatimonadetes bacterium]|nr:nucleotide exchange factor GrpE [Armatimonadota bacterium]MDW8029447.1 hypothetical protein [Armatimonadota bacterium]
MEERTQWQIEAQKLAASDVGFAAGMLIAQLLQAISKLSDEVAGLKNELAQWRNVMTALMPIAEQGQRWEETIQKVQQTLLAFQQVLAQQLLVSWQQSPIAETLTKWASFTLGYKQNVQQIVADAKGSTNKVQFVHANSVRIENLARPFSLPETESDDAKVFKPIFELEGEKARNEALQQLAEMGIVLKVPQIGEPFDPKWQQIISGEFTSEVEKNDTIAKVHTPAIFVDGEPVISARVVVWKSRSG